MIDVKVDVKVLHEKFKKMPSKQIIKVMNDLYELDAMHVTLEKILQKYLAQALLNEMN